MDDLEARTQNELTDVILILTELTGLPSRWSGRIELVPNAEFKGRKRQMCDIQIDAALAAQDERWPILIHEALHSISAEYRGTDFQTMPGWEEGVVEYLQRHFCPVIFNRLGIPIALTDFALREQRHQYNKYIKQLDLLRQALDYDEPQFFLDLLKVSIRERPGFIFGQGNLLLDQERVRFVRLFSSANSVLKDF